MTKHEKGFYTFLAEKGILFRFVALLNETK